MKSLKSSMSWAAGNLLQGTALDYQWLFAATEEAVMIVDASSECIVEANPSALRLLAGSAASIIGAPLAANFTPDCGGPLRAGMTTARVQQDAPVIAARVRRSQSSVDAQVSMFRTDSRSYFLVRLTAGKATPAAAGPGTPRSDAFNAIDHALFGFVMTDSRFCIEYTNGAFRAMSGELSTSDLLGSPFSQWVTLTPQDISGFRSQRARRLASTNLATTMRHGYRGVINVAIDAICVPAGADSAWGFVVKEAAALH